MHQAPRQAICIRSGRQRRNGAMKSYLEYYLETVKKNLDLPTLRELEKDYLGFLLEVTRHNIAHVSRILAVSRTAVYHKISRYSISKTH